jgi:hypothetical protein
MASLQWFGFLLQISRLPVFVASFASLVSLIWRGLRLRKGCLAHA